MFDTAFHTTLPAAAQTYALPRTWTTEWGIHRYGFHGLSHAYCARRAAEMLGHSGSRLVIAHLGNGASVSAVRNGICMDTSMGFTPLEGVVMGTRSGSLDPGVLLYLLRQQGADCRATRLCVEPRIRPAWPLRDFFGHAPNSERGPQKS